MERLMELVAASFARHGIECTSGDAKLSSPSAGRSTSAPFTVTPEPALAVALPEHNYGKKAQADPSP
jgi:hypothetical protein